MTPHIGEPDTLTYFTETVSDRYDTMRVVVQATANVMDGVIEPATILLELPIGVVQLGSAQADSLADALQRSVQNQATST